MNSDFTVIYAAVGDKYLLECLTSIKSLLRFHDSIPVKVLTCGQESKAKSIFAPYPNVTVEDLYSDVKNMGLNPGYAMEASRGLKISVISRCGSDIGIFLDTDTYICKPIDRFAEKINESPFGVVLTNEPAAAHVDTGSDRPNATQLLKLSQDKFFNSGVYGFRKNESTLGFEEKWKRIFLDQKDDTTSSEWRRLCDQTAFNAALSKYDPTGFIVLSNTIWNAQCKILNELKFQDRLKDVAIIHCKLMHAYDADIEKVVQSEYVKRFRLP